MINQEFIYGLLFLGLASCSEDSKPLNKDVKETPIVEPEVKSPGFVFTGSIFANMVIAMNARKFEFDFKRLSALGN